MAVQTERTMTVAEYLEWEERQEIRHEFIDGEIIEMSGGSGKHSKIAMNIALALGSLVNLLNFVFHSSNMRIRIREHRYVYPDLCIVGHDEIYEDESELTLLNPVFVVEVTSSSSAMRDRVDKLGYYGEVPSIKGYLIVDQDRPRADLYTRSQEGWHLQIFNNAEAVIPLPMLDCELSLAQVYRGIEIAEA
ncbi:MAG: Uma2 family endonuclease [Chloroflexi bacterium]|nr:Uma2 family endonuclease [Chloroflexota bacterium]